MLAWGQINFEHNKRIAFSPALCQYFLKISYLQKTGSLHLKSGQATHREHVLSEINVHFKKGSLSDLGLAAKTPLNHKNQF